MIVLNDWTHGQQCNCNIGYFKVTFTKYSYEVHNLWSFKYSIKFADFLYLFNKIS